LPSDGHQWFLGLREQFACISSGLDGVGGGQQYSPDKKATHATASVFIKDNESGLLSDCEQLLEKLAPHGPTSQYLHNRTGEDNADAHLKRQIMGREVVVAITKGMLDFGPWEQIFYGEFDGRRRKRVLVKIIGE
jgi:secondary thiamine-phosphate synthase enzyme